MRYKPILNLIGKIRASLWGFRVALGAVVLTASVSALRLTFHLGYHYHLFRCTRLVRLTCYLSMEGSYILVATFALILSAVGLWSRRVLGFLLSLLALALLGEVYRQWYLGTLSLMEMYGLRNFSQNPDQQQYLLPLEGAAWWDIVVLGVALIVLVWQVVMLKRVLKPVAIISENQPAN